MLYPPEAQTTLDSTLEGRSLTWSPLVLPVSSTMRASGRRRLRQHLCACCSRMRLHSVSVPVSSFCRRRAGPKACLQNLSGYCAPQLLRLSGSWYGSCRRGWPWGGLIQSPPRLCESGRLLLATERSHIVVQGQDVTGLNVMVFVIAALPRGG